MSPRLFPALFVLLWATGFIGARYAMPYAEPFGFLMVRFALAGLILGAAARFFSADALGRRLAMHSVMAGILMHGVYLGGVFWAVRHGMPAGLSALIVGLQPVITAFLARFALGDAITARHWTGLAAGFAGVALVLAPKLGSVDVSPETLLACVLAVLGMSAGTVWQKKYVHTPNLVAATAWQYAGGVLFTLPLALMTESGQFRMTGELVFAMAWLVLVLSIGAIGLLMVLIKTGEIARVASLFYLVPAVTALMAWPLFGETLEPIQFLGMALAAGGVALAVRQAARPASR
ncbi:MAG: DMT family transporter [Rhizobiaceae bacterium]